MRLFAGVRGLLSLGLLSALPAGVLGGDVLSTNGYSSCLDDSTIKVDKLNVSYNKNTRVITFDVAGSSSKQQNVTAELFVTAYGKQVYTKSFNPCDYDMSELCPVPAESFSSQGQQTIPQEYASQIPSIAFSIPDLDGDVKLELHDSSSDKNVACIESTVSNGRTMNIPSVQYVAAGVAAGALAVSGLSVLAAGGHPGAATSSPSFGETIGWFQSMALNGMMSVKYPKVYQSFAGNFAFSTGLVPWGSMQTAIDNFRKTTGGNLTSDSYLFLKNNATLVYTDGSNNSSSSSTSSKMIKRALDAALLWARDGTTVEVNGESSNVGGDGNGNGSAPANPDSGKQDHFVSGIEAYVEQLSIPKANTFMTLLLVWAIVVGAIIVFILLFKVILEAWSMLGNIPASLESWRKRYWWRLAKAITNLILLLYGIWTMYCIYQWTNGDSWAAKLLAGITFGLFTAILAWFTWRIYSKAHEYKKLEGDTSKLYEDKETWIKYNLFYENYKKNYWWVFVPAIVYMFARGVVIAGANGHGLIQTGGQLIVEALFLILLLWTRPFQRKSGIWINLVIQTVRVLSVICVLVFVEELGISQTTKTVTGIVLIVVQCTLTGVLAILIAINSLITCIRENPHRRQRKAAEKLNRDLDNLTPLDARNSLLMEPMAQRDLESSVYKAPLVASAPAGDGKGRYDPVPRVASPAAADISYTRPSRYRDDEDHQHLVTGAADMGYRSGRSPSRSPEREPTLPDLGGHTYGRAY